MLNTFFEYFQMALRSLVRRKLRSWLTMIGIFIGIAAVVSLIGLGDGLRSAITGQFGFLGPDVLTVQASGMTFMGPPGTTTPNPITKDMAEKIESVPGVDIVIKRYLAIGTLEFNKRRAFGYALSIPDGEYRAKLEEMINLKVDEGRLLKDGDEKKVILGNDFKKKENGFDKSIAIGDKIILNGIQFEVIGFIEKKGSFVFDSSVWMNEKVLIDEFRKGDDSVVNIVTVKVKDLNEINTVKENIEKLLRKERHVKKGEEDFSVESAQKTLDTLSSSLFAVTLFVYIIASISLLVGGIGITNTMYTAVLERRKEIGILKSIGAKNNAVFSLFALESGLLGLVGGIIGIMGGLIFAYGLAYMGRLFLGSELIQVHITLFLLIGSLMFSFFVGIIAGLLPAMQAAKLKPVDALRK